MRAPQRPDPTKCRSGKHEWVEANIRRQGTNTCCRVCADARRREWSARNYVPNGRPRGRLSQAGDRYSMFCALVEDGFATDDALTELGMTVVAFYQMCWRWKFPVSEDVRVIYRREHRAARALRQT